MGLRLTSWFFSNLVVEVCKSFFFFLLQRGREIWILYFGISNEITKKCQSSYKTFYIKLISLKNCHIQKITSNRSQREQGKIKHISIAKQESKTKITRMKNSDFDISIEKLLINLTCVTVRQHRGTEFYTDYPLSSFLSTFQLLLCNCKNKKEVLWL